MILTEDFEDYLKKWNRPRGKCEFKENYFEVDYDYFSILILNVGYFRTDVIYCKVKGRERNNETERKRNTIINRKAYFMCRVLSGICSAYFALEKD